MSPEVTSITFLCLLFTFASCSVLKRGVQTCGYESCNAEKPGMINVHLVPHTHDDVGWLMTVDQYYYKEVQFILDGVIPELAADPNKRFIYVEIAYFSRWYNEQDDATKQLVQELVNEGRLEFIIGGWCMSDEAVTHYTATIDHHKLGFEFLRENLGDCARPKIGWQIDPFGHSREGASLFAQFGFDGLFFGRLDYQDKEKRQKDKTMEFVWKGSPTNLGDVASLFTGVLPNGYNPPDGYCFDITCLNYNADQTVIMDDPRLHDYNVNQMVDGFIRAVQDEAQWYATNHLIMTMGSDFNYIQAHMFFKEMDKLIEYVNARQVNGSNINVLYSTPSCYLKQLNNDNQTWTTKQDDFFPYADRPHGFWTGYFTSRPAMKHYARVVNSFFQSVKQMAALTQLTDFTSGSQIQHLAETLGVAQHHDAITGTEKQAVTYDYAQRLADGVNAGLNVVNKAYGIAMSKTGTSAPEQTFCPLLNISICDITTNSNSFQVNLYNPLARKVTHYARVPVEDGFFYVVYAEDGVTNVPSDLTPVSSVTSKIPGPRSQAAIGELVFPVSLPPLGFVTYFVRRQAKSNSLKFETESQQPQTAASSSIQNKYYSLTFNDDGFLVSITNLTSGQSQAISQNFFYYRGYIGNNSDGNFQTSGAYIFRPVSNIPTSIPLATWSGVKKGTVVQEVSQQFTSWLSQVYRLYEDKPYVEVEWTVGPIPIDDHQGKEIVTRYNLKGWGNGGVFYTDANGREVQKRVLNFRPTWPLNQTEPVAGNYYPVNAFIGIKNGGQNLQFTVLTDRSQGGVSLNDGDVELMLHRRLLGDDAKGVGEALNETGADGKGLVVRGKHYLIFDTVAHSARLYRTIAQEAFLTPQLTFSNLAMDPPQFVQEFYTYRSGLQTPLPHNIHLLTLQPFRNTGPVPNPSNTFPYLLRFEHFYENEEDIVYSRVVTFDIKNTFSSFTITDVHELSLGANIPIEEVHRLTWKTQDSHAESPSRLKKNLNGTTITLDTMEIITLQANIPIF